MGLLDGIGYALGAGADVAAVGAMDQFRSLVEQDRQAALAQIRQQMESSARKQQGTEMTAEAQRIAGERGTQRLAGAEQAYADAGMADDPAVKTGLINAKREQSVPNSRDSVQASVNLGYEKPSTLLQIDKMDQQASAAGRLADLKEQRQDAWQENESAKRANEDRRIDAMFAKIASAKSGEGGETAKRVAEAKQIMAEINKERSAAKKPLITFEDAMDMHFKGDPAPKTVTQEDAFGNKKTTKTRYGEGEAPSGNHLVFVPGKGLVPK